MKKIIVLLCVCMLWMVGCQKDEVYSFKGEIQSIDGVVAVVKVLDGEDELSSSDLFSVYLGEGNDSLFNVGDTIEVTYDGGIMESYPAQVNEISIKAKDGTVVTIETVTNYDGEDLDETVVAVRLMATIISVEEDGYLIEPVEGSNELASTNRIRIYTEDTFDVGDKVSIIYDGEIMESDPAQINMNSIELLE